MRGQRNKQGKFMNPGKVERKFISGLPVRGAERRRKKEGREMKKGTIEE